MITFSLRFPRKVRLSVGLVLLLIAVLSAGRLAIGLFPQKDVPAGVEIKVQAGKTEEQRQTFLRDLGWEVEPEPIEVVDVIIPNEFEEVYTTYNNIQKQQGMSLDKYRGKRCKRYTYVVNNHPSGAKEVRANLLVCSGKIIGGDICSLGLNGFMHSLIFPKEAKVPQSSQPAPRGI